MASGPRGGRERFTSLIAVSVCPVKENPPFYFLVLVSRSRTTLTGLGHTLSDSQHKCAAQTQSLLVARGGGGVFGVRHRKEAYTQLTVI